MGLIRGNYFSHHDFREALLAMELDDCLRWDAQKDVPLKNLQLVAHRLAHDAKFKLRTVMVPELHRLYIIRLS